MGNVRSSEEERKRQLAEALYAMQPKLRGRCFAKYVPEAYIDDLIVATIAATVERFDPTRGTLSALAYTILDNRIADLFKDMLDEETGAPRFVAFDALSACPEAQVDAEQETALAANEAQRGELLKVSKWLGELTLIVAEARAELPVCESLAHVGRALATLDAEFCMAIRPGDKAHKKALADWSALAIKHMGQADLCLPAPPLTSDLDIVNRLASLLVVRLTMPGASAADGATWLLGAIELEYPDLDIVSPEVAQQVIVTAPDAVEVVIELLKRGGYGAPEIARLRGNMRKRKCIQRTVTKRSGGNAPSGKERT